MASFTYLTTNSADNYATPDQLSWDFEFNATRISTSEQHYIIPFTYDHGYIIARVRGVGRHLFDITKNIYTPWTSDNSGSGLCNLCVCSISELPIYPSLSTCASIGQFSQGSLDINKNWQVVASFAEEGKRKDVISYIDGSNRVRQAIAKSNTDEQTIVSSTLYDFEGRPAINILPTPVKSKAMEYVPGLNQDAASSTAYTKEIFDVDGQQSSCTTLTPGLSSVAGSSNYYSDANSYQEGYQSYTPQSNNFPFAQTEYTSDNTGRIRKQGSVGPDFQLGKFDTKFYYGQPEQVQLDRLFGSEAGYYNHYKKNATIDQNGQISVSYLDVKGKVIATALVNSDNSTPYNLDQDFCSTCVSGTLDVDYINTSVPEADYLYLNPNIVVDGNSVLFTKQLLVTSPGAFHFDYNLFDNDFILDCNNLCYDCIYDLEISIIDECGAEYPNPRVLEQVTDVLDHFQDQITNHTFFTENLELGTYTLQKKLTVNEAALDFYTQDYLQSNCLTPLEDFITTEENEISVEDCDITCDECVAALGTTYADYQTSHPDVTYRLTETEYDAAIQECVAPCAPENTCETQYLTLLSDVRPGGQYAEYKITPGSNVIAGNYFLSVLNVGNVLPLSNNTRLTVTQTTGANLSEASWKHPYLDDGQLDWGGVLDPAKQHYFDANNTDPTLIKVRKISATQFEPELDNPPLPLMLDADFPNDFVWVEPQYLKYDKDFYLEYVNHPDWAKSLVCYHPEFIYSVWCRRNNDRNYSYVNFNYINQGSSTIRPLTSDGFDSLLIITDTYDGALNFFSNGSGGMANLENLDPFFKDATDPIQVGPNGGQGVFDPTTKTLFFDKLNNYFPSQTGISGNLQNYVAYLNQCGGEFYQCSTSPTCTYTFGNPATKDEDWVAYKNLYLSEKQIVQQINSNLYARDPEYLDHQCLTGLDAAGNTRSYIKPGKGSYNGCIGVPYWSALADGMLKYTEYFPQAYWNYGFVVSSPPTGTPCTTFAPLKEYLFNVITYANQSDEPFNFGFGVFDPNQPCYYKFRKFYNKKVKRFPSGDDVTRIFNNQTIANSNFAHLAEVEDYENYIQTGQCPIVRDLQALLNSLATNGRLCPTGSPYSTSLSAYPAFTKLLYDEVSKGNPNPPTLNTGTGQMCPLYKYNWNFNSSQAPNRFEFETQSATPHIDCYIELAFPVGSTYTFDLIKGILKLRATGINDFEATAMVMDGATLIPVKITGAIHSMDLNTCTFSEPTVCEPNQVAIDYQELFSALVAHKNALCPPTGTQLLSTQPVLLLDPTQTINESVEYQYLMTGNIKSIFSHLDASNEFSIPTSIYWQTINTPGSNGDFTAQLGYSGQYCDFSFSQNLTTPIDWQRILYFDNVRPDENDPLSFYMDAIYQEYLQPPCTTLFDPGTLSRVTIHITNSSGCYAWGNCNPPQNPSCNGELADLTRDFAYLLHRLALKSSPTSSNRLIPSGSNYPNDCTGSNSSNFSCSQSTAPDIFDVFACVCEQQVQNWEITPLLAEYLGGEALTSENGLQTLTHKANQVQLLSTDAPKEISLSFRTGSSGNGIGWGENNEEYNCSVRLILIEPFSTATVNFRFSDITDLINFRVDYSTPDEEGVMHNFFITAVTPNGNFELSGSSCLPLAPCIPCTAIADNLNMKNDFSWSSIPNMPFNSDLDVAIANCSVLGPNNLGYSFNCSSGDGDYALIYDAYSDLCLNNCTTLYQGFIGNDHTGNGSLFLAAQLNKSGQKVWEQSTNVKPNTEYYLRFFFTNIDASPNPMAVNFIPRIIEGSNTFILPGKITNVPSGQWQEYTCSWNSGSYTGSVDVSIYAEFGPPSLHAAVGLDDISFSSFGIPCEETPNPLPQITVIDPCVENLQELILSNAYSNYQEYIHTEEINFRRQYMEKCLTPFETFTNSYAEREYHFTLYYYDQAGNLIKTVPPEGVRFTNDYSTIKADRKNNTHTSFTHHNLETKYEYNSLNQLIKQYSPDHYTLDYSAASPVNFPSLPAFDAANFVATSTNFTSGSTGFMTGYNSQTNQGYILGTADGGLNWYLMSEIGVQDLTKIQMLDNMNGFAIGKNGTLVKTTNGGDTWSVIPTNVTEDLNDLYFESVTEGLIVGNNNTILRYSSSSILPIASNTPGGNFSSVTKSGLCYIFALNQPPNTTLAGSASEMYFTNNISSPGLTKVSIKSLPIRKIRMQDNLIGFAAGDNGMLLITEDAGSSWQAIPLNYTSSNIIDFYLHKNSSGISGVYLTDADHTLHVLQNSTTSTTFSDIYAISIFDNQTSSPNGPGIIYVGGNGTANVVSKMDDIFGSQTITSLGFPIANSILKIVTTGDPTQALNQFVVSDNSSITYYWNYNSGSPTWTPVNLSGLTTPIDFFHIDFTNGTGVALNIAGRNSLTFTPSPCSLVVISTVPNSTAPHSISFVDETTGIFWDGTQLFKTSDGGSTWGLPITPSTIPVISTITNLDANNTEFLGSNTAGEFFKFNGSDWVDYTLNTTWPKIEQVKSDISLPGSEAFAVGDEGLIYHIVSSTGSSVGGIYDRVSGSDLNAVEYNINTSASINILATGGTEILNSKTVNGWSANLNSIVDEHYTDLTMYGSDFWACGLPTNSINHGIVYQYSSSQTYDLPDDFIGNGISTNETSNPTIFVVGNGGAILKKTNSSSTWVNVTSITAPKLNHVSMYNSNNGFAIGDGGIIYSTTDAGVTWTQNTTIVGQNLTDIEVAEIGGTVSGFITGTHGTLLAYDISATQNWSQVTGVSTNADLMSAPL